MNLAIVKTEAAGLEEWRDTWLQCDYATYFHSPDWVLTWQSYSGGIIIPKTKKITFSDGKTAFLILSEKKRLSGLFSVYESSPGHCYGGWISSHPLNKDHAKLLASFLHNHHPNLIWRLNPYDPLSGSYGYSFKDDRTFTVPLELSRDELHKKFKKRKILKKANMAERNGFRLEKLTASSLSDYERIYEEARMRWKEKGTSNTVYDIRLFELFMQSGHCDFWGVFQGSTLICAGPVFKSKKHVVCWLTLARTEYLGMKPYEFFYYHLINLYKDQGYTWFDFNPSGGLKGLEHFKKGFATTPLPSPVMDNRSFTLRLLQKAKSIIS